jgi:regulator of sigma E protease
MVALLTFIFILSVLVLVHEGGHFLAAKKAGIKVEEFGFGYPPKISDRKIGGTIYSINAIPFGGFVRLYGEEGPVSAKTAMSGKAFSSKSKKARAGVILAGVLANFLLAIFCFAIVYSGSGLPIKTKQVKVVGISQNSPADVGGIKENDLILKVNLNPILSLKQFTQTISDNKGSQVSIEVERKIDNPCEATVFGGGSTGQSFSCQNGNLILFLTPRMNPPENEGPLGVVVTDIEIKKYPIYQMPFRGTVEGFKEALGWGWLILNSFGTMLVNLIFRGIVPKDVSGPIGIFQVTSQVAKTGWLNVLQFMGVLSVNLAILNIMPFPALDGGKLFLSVGYELVFRKKPKESFERIANTVGVAFLVLLIILVTINDLVRIFQTTSILSGLRTFF